MLFPIFTLNVIVAIWRLVRTPSFDTGWNVIISVALAFLFLLTRTYALKVQDRVIRLEEQIRLRQILPAELSSRIPELTEDQLIAMRFCTDAELEKFTRSVLDEKLRGRKEIKSRIGSWRPDHFRV